MAELKTRPNQKSVDRFLAGVDNESRREDARTVCEIMQEITGDEPEMWGDSIVGFGSYHYIYDSGREGDWFQTGFSPRKQNLTLYIMPGFARYGELLSKLGKHKTGKSCLYINRLSDVDLNVLRELIEKSVEHVRSRHSDLAAGTMSQ